MHWTTQIDDGVATLTFDRPPRNMMSWSAMSELLDLLTDLSDDTATRVVMLTSIRPGYFIGHAELDDLLAIGNDTEPSGPVNVWGKVLSLIEAMRQPVIAAIDGQAWGGGCELICTCAVRIASPRSHFAQPEIDLGIIPGAGGTFRLQRLIGHGRAMEMIMSGRIVEAEEAHAIGLVQRLLPSQDFHKAAFEWARQLAAKPPAALFAAKAAVQQSARGELREALRNEARLFMDLQRDERAQRLQRIALARYAVEDPFERTVLA